MLRAEAFSQHFRPLNVVTTKPMYLGEFQLARPGYNDGGVVSTSSSLA
jgi:hypothetical protein